MRLPKLNLTISLSVGDHDEATEERNTDETGYIAGSGDTTLGLGFVGPGPKEGAAWD